MLAGSRWLREVPLVLEGCLDLAIGRLLLAVLKRLVLHFPGIKISPLGLLFSATCCGGSDHSALRRYT